MKLCRAFKQANAFRVDKSAAAKKSAADVFRQRHVDQLLKRALAKPQPTKENSHAK